MASKPTKTASKLNKLLALKEARLKRKEARERFRTAEVVSKRYEKALMRVAQNVGKIVKLYTPEGEVSNTPLLVKALQDYARILEPWAKAMSEKMLNDASNRDEQAWKQASESMGESIRAQIQSAPIGPAYDEMMRLQVDLITSIPRDAAERVHNLATSSLSSGVRASEIAREILRTEDVSKSKAMCIARTESSRASSVFTEVRAKSIGCLGYVWRTAGDSDVRRQHRHLEGKYFTWNDPPVAGSNGEKAHAGCIYNCRCWMEPVLPDIIE